MSYQDLYQQSIEQPEVFWRKQKELVDIIRRDIGAVAYFRQSGIVKRLPKTRSGKILRKTIRKLAVETEVSVPPTIDDPIILDEIRDVMRERGIGQYAAS